MSFRCGFCGEVQPVGIKPVRVVTKIRQTGERVRLINYTTAEYIFPRQEIVKEVLACPSCAMIIRKPEVVEVV